MNKSDIKKSIITTVQDKIKSNLKLVISISILIVVLFISYQVYSFLNLQKLKNTSVKFFNHIEGEQKKTLISDLSEIAESDNFFSILSKLKLINEYIDSKNYKDAILIYEDILSSKKIKKIYKSAISAQGAYAFIDISYKKNSLEYLNIINKFISNIDINLESYYSISLELEYLLSVMEIDISNLSYKKNKNVLDIFNKINNSEIISSQIKERVKKIHEFQIYK